MSGVVYGGLWVLFNLLARVFFRYRTTGTGGIPRRGGVIFAANHASYLDIPLLGCGIPRRVSFLGRANLFPNKAVGLICRWLGWIPLKPGRIDRQALGEAIARLKAGKPVVIFPEGTRTTNGQLQAGKPGIGMLVAEAQCPVIPVYIAGTYQVLPIGATWPRYHAVSVHFGAPLTFPPPTKDQAREFYQKVSSTVMQEIAALARHHARERAGRCAAMSRSSHAEDRAGNDDFHISTMPLSGGMRIG